MNLSDYLKENKQTVEAAMATFFPKEEGTAETIYKAMSYSLEAGGKRLRPILVIAGAEAVGGTAKSVLPTACALEMIHTFSLVHDDLPAMDNDDLRRGKPTNHKVFGEAMAILAGDGLATEAFRVMARYSTDVEPARLVKVIDAVATATGYTGMIGGQVLDMEGEKQKLSQSELERIHRFKTGRLITVSVVAGAMLANATTAQIESLTKYGDAIGLAFQIADDILDIEGTTEELGKPQGSDVAREKSTFPALLGLDQSKRYMHEVVEKAKEALAGFDSKADALRAMADYIVKRKN